VTDLSLPGLTDEIAPFARVPADLRAGAARYVRRACPDAALILAMLDLEES